MSDETPMKRLKIYFHNECSRFHVWACQNWRDDLWENSLIHWERMVKPGLLYLRPNTWKITSGCFVNKIWMWLNISWGNKFCARVGKTKSKSWCCWPDVAAQSSWLHTSPGSTIYCLDALCKYWKNISLPTKCFYWVSEKTVKASQLQNTFLLTITPFPLLVQFTACAALLAETVWGKKQTPKGSSCQ